MIRRLAHSPAGAAVYALAFVAACLAAGALIDHLLMSVAHQIDAALPL